MGMPMYADFPQDVAPRDFSINVKLRHLDVDDLYLLRLLGDGKRLADGARALSLTQPAITHRIHKMEEALGVSLLERSIRGTNLTHQGLAICQAARDAIRNLEEFFTGNIAI